MLVKWDQAIFPHVCRSDGKGGEGVGVVVVHRWEASVLIIAVYWLAARAADSRKWRFNAAKATSVQPTFIKHCGQAGSEKIFIR